MPLPLAFSCSLNVQENITVDQCLVPSNYIHSLHVQNHHQYTSVPLPSLHSFNVQQTIDQCLVPSNYIHSLHVQNHHQYKLVLLPPLHFFKLQQTIDQCLFPLTIYTLFMSKTIISINQCLYPHYTLLMYNRLYRPMPRPLNYIHSLHVQKDQYKSVPLPFNYILLMPYKISLYIDQ